MQVILLKDVRGLGKTGELKEVKDGYGKNFLIAKGLAKAGTTANVRMHEAAKARDEAAKQAQLQTFQDYKVRLEGQTFQMPHKLGKNGSLYGAITKQEISDFMGTQGFEIDKKSIDIKTPIKSAGLHSIDLKLGLGIHATLGLEIVGEVDV